MKTHVLVRWGELFLKSPKVKRQMQNLLSKNIRNTLLRQDTDHTIEVTRDRIIIKSHEACEAAEQSSRVFGVESTSPAIKIPAKKQHILSKASDYAVDILQEEDTFAVRARRQKNFPQTSVEIERTVGARIQEKIKNQVDLTNPDKTIYIEVWGEYAYVFHEVFEGVGGLPYGSQDHALGLIENQSDVSACLKMMSRGVQVTFYLVNRNQDLTLIKQYCPTELNVKTEGLTDILAEGRGFKGIVCGESLDCFQKRFKKRENLELKTRLPVFRPCLIGEYINTPRIK